MHLTGQNINTMQGDTENIAVVLDLSDAPGLDIEACDFTWAVYRQTTSEIVMQKTTVSGITADNLTSEILIHIGRDETDNNEYTVFTGQLNVDLSPI